MLVEKGADVNARSKLGRTPLIVTAGCDVCSATVKLLLDRAPIQSCRQRGQHRAQRSCLGGQFRERKTTARQGRGRGYRDAQGYTPMASAASNCNLEFVRLFLSKGADVNAANTRGGEVKFGKIQLIKLTPLMLASTFCAPEVVKTLLDAGAKVNAADVRGMTPIQFAVSSEEQNPAVVKLLLSAGAEVNATSSLGETALDWRTNSAIKK